MKTCYIISTCDKYLETRVKFQMESFLKDVPQCDIYYLTSKSNIEKRQFGWNCMDDPQNITWKYIHFIHNMNITNYDWYIFIHDDTFVFKNRLDNLLKNYNYNDCYYIGKELNYESCFHMSGGAGYIISKALYTQLYSYIHENGINNSYKHSYNDLCFGLWIRDIENKIKVNKINSNLFNIDENRSETEHAITIHKVINEEQYIFYSKIADKDNNIKLIEENKKNKIVDTVITLVSDLKYYNKAKRTIIDLRTIGKWNGDIVMITIDFDLNVNFKDFYDIIEVKFPQIDKTILLNKIGMNGFSNNPDKRELNKLNQWEKLHVFDDYFLKWSRVIFFDAGLRILDDIKYLLELDYKDRILAPKDGKLYEDSEFNLQISYDNKQLVDDFKEEFGENVLKSNHMLNCMWIYDTNLLKLCNKKELIEAMNKYTFCKNNEMVIMNIIFHFKYNLWERLPINASNGKILFDWSELNNEGTNWRKYCFIKYPATISFEDT